jgi:uncharacterized protein YndB with AHSA1/START domain
VSSRILVALRVPGSPERAFRVFTEETALWWRPNLLFNFTTPTSGEVAFEPPTQTAPGRFIERSAAGEIFVIGEIKVWDPPKRLIFAWRQASFEASQATEVEVVFEQVQAETRVTVQHRGWDEVPQTHVARHGFPPMIFAQRLGEGWRALLTGLGKHLT